ncbi:MAG: tRNA threonylcarbamoyladenosine dehydratase [Bacteroidales bacterium]|nr:tRNA threonylcarbamoyladenosine dehydratase [Bacteroidales bacterium]
MFTRTQLLLKPEGLQRLKDAHVLVVGLGGVGGYTAEMLCRAGVGKLTIVDHDSVSESNINRQVIALHSTVGMPKTELFRQRFADINPDCQVRVVDQFLRDEATMELLQSDTFSYVADAIDTLSPKVFLLYHARTMNIPVVSSMGSAGKLDPLAVTVADISKSHTCPLAAVVRKRLHRMNINDGIKVVFSTEKVAEHAVVEDPSENKRTTIGTISYLPPLFGCICASVIINDIVNENV